MIKKYFLSLALCIVATLSFGQRLIISQNHTKGYEQYAIVANKLNEAFFNNGLNRRQFQNLSKCKLTDEQIKVLAEKFRKLYPGLTYHAPAIEFPVTNNSDTMWYEETYVKINEKKREVKYCLQVKVIFDGNDPEGEMYYPYIANIEVKGPGEIKEYDRDTLLSKSVYEKKKRKRW